MAAVTKKLAKKRRASAKKSGRRTRKRAPSPRMISISERLEELTREEHSRPSTQMLPDYEEDAMIRPPPTLRSGPWPWESWDQGAPTLRSQEIRAAG